MHLTVDEILDRVKREEDDRADRRKKWEDYERMYDLDAGFRGTLQTDIMEGRERVISPRPKNTINIAKWNVGTQPKVMIPPASADLQDSKYADECERWLVAAWQQVYAQQSTNVIQNAFHHEFVNGEHIFEVKWPDNRKSPKVLRDRLFPISVRALHPSVAGVHRGPHYVEYGYTNYKTTLLNILQLYPELRKKKWNGRFGAKMDKYLKEDRMREAEKVEIVEMFWVGSEDGEIWQALLVDDEFIPGYEPEPGEYPLVPFVAGSGNNFESLLAASDGLWQAECRLMSYGQTGVMQNALKTNLYESETGEPIPDIPWGKGGYFQIPFGTRFVTPEPTLDFNLVQGMLGMFGQMLDQSSFPGVTSGQVSGSVQAGYAIQNLQESAIGRIEPHRQAVERSVAYVNQLMLAYVDHIAPKRGYKDGVQIWGRSERDGKAFRINLNKEMIDGYYENAVTLQATNQADDIAKMNLILQWHGAGLISGQTAHDKGMPENIASDEQMRVNLDKLMNSEQMTPIVMVMTAWEATKEEPDLFETYVDSDPNWRAIAEKLKLVEPKPQPEAQPGMHQMPDGSMMPNDQMMGGGPPGGMGGPLPGEPPGMMNGSMGPPPMPPEMMGPPPPMEPPMQEPMLPPGEMLPPMNPAMGLGGAPGTGGGIPPAIAGQLEAENIGLPPDAPAFMTQQALGNEPTDQEILDSLLSGQI